MSIFMRTPWNKKKGWWMNDIRQIVYDLTMTRPLTKPIELYLVCYIVDTSFRTSSIEL
jgi:hypothetical protein